MKQVRDALLYLFRSIVGYAAFYGLWRLYFSGSITGVSLWVFLLVVLIVLELIGLLVVRVMKKLFDYDPQFMFKMPILVYAMYRMGLEFIFLIFLFAIFRPSMPGAVFLVFFVGLLYFFGVLRHWIRQNRMMIEGRAPTGNRRRA